MRGRQAPSALAAALLVGALTVAARADDAELERLRATNARLEARLRELERENAELRARAGAVEETATRSVTARVDEERAVTSLDVEPTRLELTGGNRSRHWIALHAEQGAGTTGGTAAIEIEAAASNGAYRAVRELELSLDGNALTLPITDHTATPIFAGPQHQRLGERETVSIAAPADTVARIGAAREVRGRLGPTTFVLTPSQVASFGALGRRLAGAAR